MKKIHLLFIFAAIFNFAASAQTVSNKEKLFLEWFFTKHLKIDQSKILYVNKSSDYTIKELTKHFDKDTLNGFILGRNIKVKPQIVYTKTEKKHILDEIEKLKTQTLPDNILPFAKIISQDTLNAIFKYGANSWNNAYKKGISGYYNFNKPIFFRHDTLCIFQYGYSCGNLCGYGTTSVYKKTENGWIEFLQLENWIS